MTAENKAKKDIIYADLSGQIIGLLFDVYNHLGHGHPEKTYQRAVAAAFTKASLKFVEQLYVPVLYEGKVVGKNYFDFFVEDKIVVEIKKGDYFVLKHINQVYQYLVSKDIKLGILAYFAPKTVHLKRVVNLGGPYIRN
jgi:GxxExxY protein